MQPSEDPIPPNGNITGWPRLRAEGRQHNLIPYSNIPERHLPQDHWPEKSGDGQSIVGGEKASYFHCTTDRSYEFSVARPNPLDRKDFTFSVFACLGEDTATVPCAISLSDGNERRISNSTITNRWTRISCSVEFAEVPQVTCSFKLLPIRLFTSPRGYLVSLTPLDLEEGLFPSSPVPTTSVTGFKDADLFSMDTASSDENPLQETGTILLAYQPMWRPSQLTRGINPAIFEIHAAESQGGITVFHDSLKSGQIGLRVWDEKKDQILSFDGPRPPPSNQVFVVSLSWRENQFSLFLDGDPAIVGNVTLPMDGAEKLFIASRPDNKDESLFAHLVEFRGYTRAIEGQELRSFLYVLDPNLFARFATDHENQQIEFDSNFHFGSELYRGLVEKLMVIVMSWPKLEDPFTNEGQYRDDCGRLMLLSGFISSRESLTQTGNTDLVVHLPNEEREMGPRTVLVRTEFKIWGRNDYKDVPEKPIKYMDEWENVGVVVMISLAKKKNIRDEFIKNVRENSNYPHEEIWEQPFGDLLPYHFVGRHVDDRNGSMKDILYLLASPVLLHKE